MENLDLEEKRNINIYPTKVGRRVLVFLAEIFTTLIISIILFELVIFQISRPIIHYSSLNEEITNSQNGIYDIFYENNILYYENKDTKYNINTNLEYTNNLLLKYYTFENEEDSSYEVFYNYFVNIKKMNVSYLNSLYLNSGGDKFFNTFEYTSLGTYSLKDYYKDLFSHNYLEGDEMSTTGYTEFNNFRDNIFVKVYGEFTNDIIENDIYSLDKTNSYNLYQEKISENETILQNDYIICSYISFFITCIILYIIIPLCNSKRQTFIEKILKVERVNKNTLEYLSRGFTINVSLFKIIDSLSLLFLVPFLRVGISYLFTLPYLYMPSLIAIFIALINLFITIFTTYNTSLKELSTNSIVVDESSMNKYYEELGYGK